MPFRHQAARVLAVFAAAGVLAAAGTGGAAGASTGPRPLSITISPYKITGAEGQRHLRREITVTNSGSRTLHVVTSFREVTRTPGTRCALVRPPSWVRVEPARFTLAPGAHRAARLAVAAPASATGDYDLAAVFGAAGPRTGGLTVTGAVGARVLLSLGGQTVSHPCLVPGARPVAAQHSDSAGLPWWLTAGAVLAAVALLAAAFAVVGRRRRREAR